MKRKALAFAAIVLLLLSFGCSPDSQQGAVDAQLNIPPEDLMEIKLDEDKIGSAGLNTPEPHAASPSAFSSEDTLELPPTPTPTPTPTPEPTPSFSPTPEVSVEPRTSYLLTKVDDEKGYIVSSGVNLREGPGTSYPVLDTLRSKTELVITGKTEEWYRISIGETEGFVLKEFVGLGNIPTPKPTPKKTATPEIQQGSKGNYSDDDIYLAAKLIYAEGKNQSTESFRAMANILYNRVKSKKFGGSVKTEVYRKGQFTVVTKSSFESLKPSSAALKAAREVFNEGKRVLPTGVMFFRAARLGKDWSSSRKFYKTIGGNNYYY